jgi:hypothetical protein
MTSGNELSGDEVGFATEDPLDFFDGERTFVDFSGDGDKCSCVR